MTTSPLKRLYQRLVPFPVRDGMHRVWNQRLYLDEIPYRFSPRGRANARAIRGYQDAHRGERCFIIGNGPSLKAMDLSPLKDEITFGMNRIYLMFPEMDFTPTYYVSVNALVLTQFAPEIQALTMPKFISWGGHSAFHDAPDLMYLFPRHVTAFSERPTRWISEGNTVTFVALQLAYFMGFSTVYLIGVDHSFATQGPKHETVTSGGEDPNHFHPDYFGKGVQWQLPDLDGSEMAYQLARERFAADGRRVFDATVGGQLQVFPKVDYAGLF